MVTVDWKYLLSWRPSMSPRFEYIIDKWIFPCGLAVGVAVIVSWSMSKPPVTISTEPLLCSASMFPSDIPMERPFSSVLWYGLWIEQPRVYLFDAVPYQKKPDPTVKRHR